VKQTPLQEGIFGGLAFAILWGFAVWFLAWREDTPPLRAVVFAALAGALFGLWVASDARRRRRKGPS
jgi:drug/metabolite transporter (DMT)-like permease